MEKRKRVLEASMEIKRIQKAKKDAEAQAKVFSSSSFSSLGLNPTLCDQLKERMGFESPTHIQAQAIPVILSGQHVLVNAATGTGKTVVYLAPIIHHLQNYDNRIQRSDGTFALVLVPTRELCLQVYEILQKLLHRFHWIVPGYLMGGENRSKEKARLRKGISILVATPGRLLDHLRHTESFIYTNLRWIIFDEADSILELGFGKDIEEILDLLGSRGSKNNSKGNKTSKIPQFERQNVLLSATLNEKVNNLAKISLEKPVLIGLDDKASAPGERSVLLGSDSEKEAENFGKEEIVFNGDYNVPAQLFQRYIKVPCGSRLVILLSVLKNLFEKDPSNKIVVFFSTCDAVDFHFTLLGEFKGLFKKQDSESQKKLFLKCKTFRLHGSMKHDERRTSFQAFKAEESALLLSTDVSARGLDFPRVKCIIQYDSPGEATEYVHRVGRTARLGEKGDSLLFLQPVETDYLQELEKHGVSLTEYPLVENHPLEVSLQKELESCVAKPPLMKLAKDAFCSWVRAYTAHRGELKRIFMVKKLHLGHVAKSFALRDQPTLVGASFQTQSKKRKRDEKRKGPYTKKAITRKS